MYNKFYGFSEDPFSLSPDPRFLFLAIGHYEALSSMISGIKERKGITLISGDVGTGKTTLIYTLLKDLSEKIRTAFVFQTKITSQDLLKYILLNLDVSVPNENLTTLLVLFRQYLKERMARDETVAIIIDEAQNLEFEVMENLFRLRSEDSPAAELVQILLVGQPELEAKLDSQELQTFKNRFAIRTHLRPLNEKESAEYIEHRLRVVGSSSSKVFTPQAINRISKFSNGIPRVINILCDRALFKGYKASTRKIDEEIIKKAIKELSHLNSYRIVSRPRVRPLYAILVIVILGVLGLVPLYFVNWDSKLKFPLERRGKTILLEERLIGKETSFGKEAKKATERIVSVKEGWTLSLLAKQYYNNVNSTLIDLILEANPQISNLNRIFVNQQIKIPSITEELLLIHTQGQNYKIHAGTFVTPDRAKLYSGEEVLKGKEVEILPRKVSPHETWYRVVIGKFENKNEVLKMVSLLKEKGLMDAFQGLSQIK